MIDLLWFAFAMLLAGYVGYCFGHINGFREGTRLQRKIDRNEL